ncbi:MAG TPA: GDP-mannose 4,6-dehydratase [Candidatus Tyrphobacter sp.]
MRALVTGAGGFVGRHLVAALHDDGWEVAAAGGPSDEEFSLCVDLADDASLADALERAEPDAVFHLAAQSFVPESLRNPQETYATNVLGTVRLFAEIRAYAARSGTMPRLLFTSSAEVYGARDPGELPLRESLAPQPRNPYAASKAAAEAILLGEMRALGGDVVIARAFNHIGPGQDERFAVAGFAAGLARIAAGGEPVLNVGDLGAERDVLDVRDVVLAYLALARRGEGGEIYNVCSGRAIAMRELLRKLIGIARVPVEVRNDSARMRPSEIAISFGSNAKLAERTGWSPRIRLAQSLRDIYEDARSKTRAR